MKHILVFLFLLSSFIGWGQNLRLHRYKWNKGAEVRGPVKEVKDSTVVSDWVIIQTVEYDKRKRNYYQIIYIRGTHRVNYHSTNRRLIICNI